MNSYQKLKEQRDLLAKKYSILYEACRKFVKAEDKEKGAWMIIVNALMEDSEYLL